MLIDCHTHLFRKYYPFDYIGLVDELDWIVERLWGEGKIDQAWVMSGPLLKAQAGDEAVLEAARRYPDLLVHRALEAYLEATENGRTSPAAGSAGSWDSDWRRMTVFPMRTTSCTWAVTAPTPKARRRRPSVSFVISW